MDRASWGIVSKDEDVIKKLVIGGLSLILFLPTPLALGFVTTDLENEVKRAKEGFPPGKFPEWDDIMKLVASGLGPSLIYGIVMMLLLVPMIVVLMSVGQSYAWLFGKFDVNWMSFLTTALFGLLAAAAQVVIAGTLPIALAKYAQGQEIRACMSMLNNFALVFEMGGNYIKKASGLCFGSFAMILLYGLDVHWLLYGPLQAVVAIWAFQSLLLGGRHALQHLMESV